MNRTKLSRLVGVLIAACLSAWTGTASGQDEQETREVTSRRGTSLLLGFGNTMGWFGAQAERHFMKDRISLFVGLGYTSQYDDGAPTGVSAAAGARVFTSGETHRGFLEVSVSQLSLEIRVVNGVNHPGPRRYGPGVQVGYHYIREGGFTALVSGGVGYAVGSSPGLPHVQSMATLAAGYTWGR